MSEFKVNDFINFQGQSTQPPFFIIGCERSGTSLLQAMLNSHSQLAVAPEANSYTRLVSLKNPWNCQWPRSQALSVIREILANHKFSLWDLTEEDVFLCLPEQLVCSFADILKALYSAFLKKEKKGRWGDKTPINAFELDKVVQYFPGAQFIHIIRDGRDVYLSWKETDWAGHYSLEHAARRWSSWVTAACRFTEQLGINRYLAIRFEDLTVEPEIVLRRICAFLNVTFEASMLQYWKSDFVNRVGDLAHFQNLQRPVDKQRAAVWRKVLSKADVKRFEEISGKLLQKYDYPVNLSWIQKIKGSLFFKRGYSYELFNIAEGHDR